MKHLLSLLLVLAIAFAACEDDESVMDPPPPNGSNLDLSAFTGCWHVTSGITAFGTGECRTALDSILAILDVNSEDSVFAFIDTVTHLTLVPPYYGTGDFTGTVITTGERLGDVQAVYHHEAGNCSLTTTISGPIDSGEGSEEFSASYIVEIRFTDSDSCSDIGNCTGFATFQCTRRPLGRCGP
jgi:hypothetical protein